MMTGHETPKNFTQEWEKTKPKRGQTKNLPRSQQYQTLSGVATLKNVTSNFTWKVAWIVPIQFRSSSILVSIS